MQCPKSPHLRKISLFCIMLCRVNPVTIICEKDGGEREFVDFSTIASEATRDKCSQSVKVSLENGTILYLGGEEITNVPFEWLLSTDNLAMCLIVENTGMTSGYAVTGSFTGICEGPKLSIVNNLHLEKLVIDFPVLHALESVPNAVRVRGNRKLREIDINLTREYAESINVTLDLQTFGECALPKPFVSFETLDRSCSKFYGILTLEKGRTEVHYDSTKVHMFEIEACIQIEKTDLKDVTFLNAFSRFKPIPYCPQYIRENKNLCSKNLNYFNMYFKSVAISNNSHQLCKCMGGRLSEQYLRESVNCSLIYGDLIITHLRGLPRYIDNLRTIETIEGRLIISNNTGLERFIYLSSLKKVGLKNESDVAITVKDNADLKVLLMPQLVDVMLKKGDRRVELVNNPMLIEEFKKNVPEETIPDKVDYTSSVMEGVFVRNFGLFLTVICAAFVVLSLSILGAFVTFRKEKHILNLPELPYNLKAKSQERLVQFCTEISTKNPLVWCIEDLSLIWKRNKTATPENACGSSKQDKFMKSCMIPVAHNGKLPQRIQKLQRKSLQHRVEEMLEYDVIVMIGTARNVSNVVPGLPDVIGHLFAYEGGVIYKLIEVNQLSSVSTRFKYEVRSDKKRAVKNIELVLFHWLTEQLPVEFSEFLQLVTLVRGKKAICTSDRRKEVFSLLHLFYTNVIEVKGPQSAADVFQLHSSLCNGAPLDRREMLYIMRILLEWAKGANCIRGNIEKRCLQWCQIYDQMASFTKKHTNIMNVHPLHLTRLDGVEALNSEVTAARNRSKSLSERPFAMMTDRFRRKTQEEIKRELVKTTRTITEEYNEAAGGSMERSICSGNTLKFFAKKQARK